MFGKAVYGLAPYAVLALFVTVLTSSSSMGIAISLAYYFVELIIVQIMSGLFDWFSSVSDFLLGPNIAAWMTEPGVVTTGGNSGLAGTSDPSGTLHAFVTLLVYMAVLGARLPGSSCAGMSPERGANDLPASLSGNRTWRIRAVRGACPSLRRR